MKKIKEFFSSYYNLLVAFVCLSFLVGWVAILLRHTVGLSNAIYHYHMIDWSIWMAAYLVVKSIKEGK